MDGAHAGTDGSLPGTNGIIPLRLYGFVTALILVIILINISSLFIENPVGHRGFQDWEPWLWEVSSAVSGILLMPLGYYAFWRLHWKRLGVPGFFVAQTFCAIVFSLLHVAIMVGLRVFFYERAGAHYDFAQGDLPLQLIYEGRKDMLSYAINLGIFWGYGKWAERRETKPLPERIDVRSDGRTLYLAPSEILYAEAAGNYVDLYLTTSPKPLLLRGTLSAYEKRLSAYRFVRVHRSRLLNRSHVRSYSMTASGDLRITLSDGREVAGSRRFRDQLT